MRRTLALVLLALCAVLTTGCGAVAMGGEYTLESEETLHGDLLIMGGEPELEEGSRVTGSVIMMGGDLRVGRNAEIKGDLVMAGGDVDLLTGAVVHGDVVKAGGDVHQAEGARVKGKITSNGFGVGANFMGVFCIPPVVLFGVFVFTLISLARKRPGAKARGGCAATPVAGLVLILVGALILAQNLTDFNLSNWWALFILIPALSSLVDAWTIFQAERRLNAAVRGPLVTAVALLLVVAIFLFDPSWGIMWPMFVIIAGVGILLSR